MPRQKGIEVRLERAMQDYLRNVLHWCTCQVYLQVLQNETSYCFKHYSRLNLASTSIVKKKMGRKPNYLNMVCVYFDVT